MLCICDTDGEQSHYCSTIDTFSLFFQTNFENAKRKRKSMESIERSHYCSTIDAYFFFIFFLNLIFISITWHWYQKKKKKKNQGPRETEFWFSLLFEATVPIQRSTADISRWRCCEAFVLQLRETNLCGATEIKRKYAIAEICFNCCSARPYFYQFLLLLIFINSFISLFLYIVFSRLSLFLYIAHRVYIRVCIGVGERIKPRDYTTWRINSEYEDNRRNVGEIIKIHVALDTYIKYTASFYKYCCCLKNLNLILINVD